MNPAAATADPPAAQPPRSSFSCDRHPDEQFAGFCPECLCERLSGLDNPSSSVAAAPRKSNAGGCPASSSSAAAGALKAIFRGSDKAGNRNSGGSKAPSSVSAGLRRTKSFSASKGEGFSGMFEPQRKSCDVRVRNNLWSLFNKDETERRASRKETRVADAEVEIETLGSESKEEDENESQNQEEEEDVECMEDEGEIRVSEEAPNVVVSPVFEDCIEETVEEEVLDEVKPMKDHIGLHSRSKKVSGRDLKEIAGNFWSAASVFSKKLHKWGRKQKLKKQAPIEKRMGRRHHESQSEVADYGYGRRSCDIDPRFSLDARRASLDTGRISSDDPRYSLDEPRASWDGYLVGKTFPRLPPMLSVVEDPPAHASRTDGHISLEAPKNGVNGDEAVPGGSAQTRDYYSDSSSRRRKSLDRSNSIRKTAAAVVAEIDEMKSVFNAKVSPTTTVNSVEGFKAVGSDKELGDSNSNSLRDDCSESFEAGFNGDPKAASKKSRRWKVWNIWGLIYRRNGGKDEDEGRLRRLNGVDRSFSESWREFRREGNGEVKGGFNRRMFRSNSVSSRNSYGMSGGGSFGSARKSNAEETGHGKKKRDECVLERNRSARYSPNNIENGLLRFYLTPLRGSRRSGSGRSQPSVSHSITRSGLGLY